MKYLSSLSLSAAFFTAALLAIPSPAAAAVTRVVAKTNDQCPTVTATTICYLSFHEAVTDAVAGDTIEVRPGTHSVTNETVNKSVSIYGTEASRTILNGGGSGTILTISGVTSAMTIRNLTFFSANTGIAVRNSSSVVVRNNIFEVGTGSTAITISGSVATSVFNNTFYLNGNSIETTDIESQYHQQCVLSR